VSPGRESLIQVSRNMEPVGALGTIALHPSVPHEIQRMPLASSEGQAIHIIM